MAYFYFRYSKVKIWILSSFVLRYRRGIIDEECKDVEFVLAKQKIVRNEAKFRLWGVSVCWNGEDNS